MKRGEIEKWRESFRENCACAGGIEILIRENFNGMHLKDGTVEKIVELYGYKRVEHVLANTVQERRGDGRFRPDNRAWAESHYIPEDEMHNYCFAARSHSAILDGFISHYRTLVKSASSATSYSVRFPSEYLLDSTIRLFHQMGQIFRNNAAPPSNPMGIRIDSKRRKKLIQKRLAMGHKQDDHEQHQICDQMPL